VCGAWVVADTGEGTGCSEPAKAVYRPGHDARLASLLIRTQAAGKLVRRGDGDPVTPAEAAELIGLRYPVAERAAKLAAKQDRKKKTRTPEPKAEPQPVTAAIRRGRWDIPAATILADGSATYVSKDGQTRTAPAGSYKVLATVGGAV
jgi:hypothetical protein